MSRRPTILISSSQKALRLPRRRLERLIRFVAASEGASLAMVDLAVVGSGEIASVNRRFLSHTGATDVISFDLSEGPGRGLCVQLVVCADLALRQGPLHGLRPQHELMLYVIHGLLHMMGYEDSTVRGGARMHARQDELLRGFLRNGRQQALGTRH